MKLRVEKRKPDVLDPTIYAVDNPAFPKRKQPSLSSSRTRMPKRNNKQTAPSSVLEKEDFVSDSFTDSIYDQDTICALCTGDRKMVSLLCLKAPLSKSSFTLIFKHAVFRLPCCVLYRVSK